MPIFLESLLAQSARTADHPCADCLDRPAPIERRRIVAPRPVAFWLVAGLLAIVMLGTTLPTPLYVLYQAQWHFSAAIITLIFAVYAVGVLVALLLAGHLSDQVGRKPVLATALGLSALSTVVFIVTPDLAWLFVGRILSGLSAGLMIGAATATLTELAGPGVSRRASLVAPVVNTAGLGLGPLIAGLIAAFAADPTVVVFAVYLVTLAIAAPGLALIPETVPARRRPALHFNGLQFPPSGRREFIAAGVAAFAAFSLLGLFTALTSTFLTREMHQSNFAVSGATVFLIFAASAVTQLLLARYPSRPVVLMGLGLFPIGLASIVAGIATASLTLFLMGAVVGGAAVGAVFMGSLATASRLAPAENRGTIVSTYFVFPYVGLSIPVIGVGFASDYVGDLYAMFAFAIVLVFLCAFSVAGIWTASGEPGAAQHRAQRRVA